MPQWGKTQWGFAESNEGLAQTGYLRLARGTLGPVCSIGECLAPELCANELNCLPTVGGQRDRHPVTVADSDCCTLPAESWNVRVCVSASICMLTQCMCLCGKRPDGHGLQRLEIVMTSRKLKIRKRKRKQVD